METRDSCCKPFPWPRDHQNIFSTPQSDKDRKQPQKEEGESEGQTKASQLFQPFAQFLQETNKQKLSEQLQKPNEDLNLF
jgi:hypothetical protein